MTPPTQRELCDTDGERATQVQDAVHDMHDGIVRLRKSLRNFQLIRQAKLKLYDRISAGGSATTGLDTIPALGCLFAPLLPDNEFDWGDPDTGWNNPCGRAD